MIAPLFALQAAQGPESPDVSRLSHHLATLDKVGFKQVNGAFMACVKGEADRTRPAVGELGDKVAAAKAADGWLVRCDLDGTRRDLITRLRRRNARLGQADATAIASSGLSISVLVSHMKADEMYKIVPVSIPEAPITIPRPQDHHAQD